MSTQHRPAHGMDMSSGSSTTAMNCGSSYVPTRGLPSMMTMIMMYISS